MNRKFEFFALFAGQVLLGTPGVRGKGDGDIKNEMSKIGCDIYIYLIRKGQATFFSTVGISHYRAKNFYCTSAAKNALYIFNVQYLSIWLNNLSCSNVVTFTIDALSQSLPEMFT